MYNMDKTEGVTQFQMEIGGYLERRVKRYIEVYYGKYKIKWGEYSVWIETTDGLYDAVVINVHPSNFEVYKVNRSRGNDRIHQWLGGAVKTMRGDLYCDNMDEYNGLMREIIKPVQRIIVSMERNNTLRKYIDEDEVVQHTGVSEREHNEFTRLVTRYGKGLHDVYGVNIGLEVEEYYSVGQYMLMKTAKLNIYEGPVPTVVKFSLGRGLVEIIEGDGEVIKDINTLYSVSKQVLKTKGYAGYQQTMLLDAQKGV